MEINKLIANGRKKVTTTNITAPGSVALHNGRVNLQVLEMNNLFENILLLWYENQLNTICIAYVYR